MAIVHFYQKPGCLTNDRQKTMLVEAGHVVKVYDLLAFPWAANRALLRSFFGNSPIGDWFNPNAPMIKSGCLTPTSIGEQAAVSLMVEHPLLIRRPLLEVEGQRLAGFDRILLETRPGITLNESSRALEVCSRRDHV